ncbi:MAG: phenazine biosynthesis protein [Mesorhizobium sp.]|uniref:PhzA/PhzB family protein n=1 Tax=Mesorhizobium sp. TaxID=1871066 RepID=UPI000FE6D54A|nr:PhzA/PhzB family protein [Mesorhizobium sp.]RWI57097.1 MAG: phenazine biosynthesis protein [Mesorhizobium sp.]
MTTQQADIADLRARNRSVVEDYMKREGAERLTRYMLYTEDGTGGLHTGLDGEPQLATGRTALKEWCERVGKIFPDWKFTNIAIFDTQDPNQFRVECDGKENMKHPNIENGYYRNHFVHSFYIEN